MLMSTGRLRRFATGDSLQRFLCNRRIDILTRLRSLSRRLRIRAKCYNSYVYNDDRRGEQELSLLTEKLASDQLDYRKITKELVVELLSKLSFLSNGDCIQVANILCRIKKPLHRIKLELDTNENVQSSGTKLVEGSLSLNGATTTALASGRQNAVAVTNHESISQDGLIRLIVKAQRILFKQLLDGYYSKVLTKAQRYYLFCLFSKECSLIPLPQWLKLIEQLRDDMEATATYLPFEQGNLILIYDQLCRWILKRMGTESAKVGQEGASDLTTIEASVSSTIARESFHDPFDYGFLDGTLTRLAPLMDNLKTEKVLKLLYLQCSRDLYNKDFFSMASAYIMTNFLSGREDLRLYRTLIRIHHRAITSNLWKEIKMANSSKTLLLKDLKEIDSLAQCSSFEHGKDISQSPHLGVGTLHLRSINELLGLLCTTYIWFIVQYVRVLVTDDPKIEHIKSMITQMIETTCHEETQRSRLLDRISLDDNIVLKKQAYASHINFSEMVLLLKMVFSIHRLSTELLKHIPVKEDQIHQRSSLFHRCCYQSASILLGSIMNIREDQLDQSLHSDLTQILSYMRNEAIYQICDEIHEIQCMVNVIIQQLEDILR